MSISHQTGRGDLLRWLQRCRTRDEKCLSATILGYEWHEPFKPIDDTGKKDLPEPPKKPPDPTPISPVTDLKRPQEVFYALSQLESYADPQQLDDDLPSSLQGVQALSGDDLQPCAAGDPIPHRAIVPEKRMRDFVRRSLSHSAGQRLDLPKLVRRIARLQTLYELPRKTRVLPAGRVYVLLDLNKRLLPFWSDAHALCENIVRQHGLNGLEIRVIDDDPQGEYWDWFDDSQRPKQWQAITAQSVVFIVSDLGQLAEDDSAIRLRWDLFLQQLERKNAHPIVLAPLSAAQQQPPRQKTVRQILWNKHGKLKPQHIDPDRQAHAEHVRRVLALLSIAVHVEPELLRAILNCLPAEQADSGVEAAVYLHPDMQRGYTAISMRPEKRADYQSEFKQLDANLQFQVLSLLKRQHIGQFPAIWAEEVVNAVPLVSFPLEQLADIEWAEDFMQRLAKTMIGTQSVGSMTQFAKRHLSRLNGEAIRRYNDCYISALYGLAYREQLRAGATLPTEYDAAIVQALIRERTGLARYGIWQVGETVHITLADARPVPIGGVKLADFEAVHDSVMLIGGDEAGNGLLADRQLIRLPDEARSTRVSKLIGQPLVLDTGLVRLTLSPFRKPSWATSIAHNGDKIIAEMRFAGEQLVFRLTPAEFQMTDEGIRPITASHSNGNGSYSTYRADAPTWRPSRRYFTLGESGEVEIGQDQYGLYADLTIHDVTQRFRWIEPGSFMMGSPPDEAERFDNETLHPVTLTQGFWLADTTVTQAFWLAVMGSNNPSHFFDSADYPVQRVSFGDALLFIEILNGLMPGLNAQLPSEAQWEYACRAGTSTPFSFGPNITPEQVNYNGKYPYAGGEKGLNRGTIVPVKSLPANPWGLYEMHGNLWEWCQDRWQADLGTAAAVNPLTQPAPGTGGGRVRRGGCWSDFGRFARSALRRRSAPDDHIRGIGFRLALGLTELRPGEVGGAVKPATARDAPGPVSGVAEQPPAGRGASLLGKLLGKGRKKK